jgi:hypothetical protein
LTTKMATRGPALEGPRSPTPKGQVATAQGRACGRISVSRL